MYSLLFSYFNYQIIFIYQSKETNDPMEITDDGIDICINHEHL